MGFSADVIKQARQAGGITQAELAHRAATSQSAVAAYESGTKTPSAETLKRLLEAAGFRLGSERAPRSKRVRSLSALRRRRAAIIAVARQHHASNVRVFGSVARGAERPGSDVDLLVDMAPGASLIDQVRLRAALAEVLGSDVDIVSSGGLLPRDRHILDDAIPL